MGKYGIVVLNYLNYEDTIECLHTIRKQTIKDIPVVVVDNGSNNESVTILKKEINKFEKMYFIESQENLGFAKGNNLGITYLRNNLKIDNVFLCNNDLVFSEKKYLEKLMGVDIPNDVGAIGTAIIGKQGFDQNPLNEKTSQIDLSELVKKYENPDFKERIKQFMYKYFGDEIAKMKKSRKGKNIEYSKKNILTGKDYLHGSAIMLTENYFRVFPGLYPKTFLYGEEIILKILFEKIGLKMLYIPNLLINHKEDKSSEQSFVNNYDITNKYRYEGNKIALQVYEKTVTELKEDFKGR